jgi:D-lyxose ketol-isomerase
VTGAHLQLHNGGRHRERAGKRYVRLGPGQQPEIYPGTIEGLQSAQNDALIASAACPGVHTIHAHWPGEGLTQIRSYEAGMLTWAPGIEKGA